MHGWLRRHYKPTFPWQQIRPLQYLQIQIFNTYKYDHLDFWKYTKYIEILIYKSTKKFLCFSIFLLYLMFSRLIDFCVYAPGCTLVSGATERSFCVFVYFLYFVYLSSVYFCISIIVPSTLVSGATESRFVYLYLYLCILCISHLFIFVFLFICPLHAGKWGHSKPNLANTEDCSTEKMKSLNK